MKTLMIVTYWSFEDALIQSYTLPYVRLIKKHLGPDTDIILVTFDRNPYNEQEVEIESGITNYKFRLYNFGWRAILEVRAALRQMRKLIASRNVFQLHGWCATGNGIAWVLSRKTGLPLIADSFEPNAEPMVETGTWKPGSIAFRIQFWLEKKTAQHAAELIAISPYMQDYMEKKYGAARKIKYIKPACVDLELFSANKKHIDSLVTELQLQGKIICVYAGKIGGFYLEQELFDFFAAAEKKWGDRFRVVFLTSHERSFLDSFAIKAGFSIDKMIIRFVKHHEVPHYLGLGDFAIGPYKPVPSRLTCSPIKNGEFWALGLPIIITKGISNDTELIVKNKCGAVIESFSTSAYLTALDEIEVLFQDTAVAERCVNLAKEYRNFAIADKIYSEIYAPKSNEQQ